MTLGPVGSRMAEGIAIALAIAMLVIGCSGPGPVRSPTPRPPREVLVTVVNRTGQTPVANAHLDVGGATATTDADGTARLTAARGASVEASADGFDAGSGSVPDDGGLTILLRPNVVHGQVTDGSGKPIVGVRVFVEHGSLLAETDGQGRYTLAGVPEQGTLIYKMPGYRLGAIARSVAGSFVSRFGTAQSYR